MPVPLDAAVAGTVRRVHKSEPRMRAHTRPLRSHPTRRPSTDPSGNRSVTWQVTMDQNRQFIEQTHQGTGAICAPGAELGDPAVGTGVPATPGLPESSRQPDPRPYPTVVLKAISVPMPGDTVRCGLRSNRAELH